MKSSVSVAARNHACRNIPVFPTFSCRATKSALAIVYTCSTKRPVGARTSIAVRNVAVPGDASEHDLPTSPTPPSLDRSAPPRFIANNNVSLDGDFIVQREGEPTAAELANENLMKIVAEACTDEEVNWLVWKCLGYRYNVKEECWTTEKVFPKWRENYPEAPDLIGVTRVYTKEVDRPIMKANQALVRSVPAEYKRSIMEQLKPIGFTGFLLDELTPNRTRRAQVTNFIAYYREQLWGYSLEELQRRKRERAESKPRRPLTQEDAAE